jgi:hypothetical protein
MHEVKTHLFKPLRTPEILSAVLKRGMLNEQEKEENWEQI